MERAIKRRWQLKGQVSKGILQLPPHVEAYRPGSNRYAIHYMIAVLLQAAVEASERRQAVHSCDADIPAIGVKGGHGCC